MSRDLGLVGYAIGVIGMIVFFIRFGEKGEDLSGTIVFIGVILLVLSLFI